MANALTWKWVADELAKMPRGAPTKLAKALGILPPDLFRKISRANSKAQLGEQPAELSERHARVVREFFGVGSDAAAPAPAATSRTRLPVYGYATASDGDLIALNEGNIIDWLELPMGIVLGPGEYFVVKPMGSSMEPRIFPGEPLVVRRDFPPARGADCIIEMNDGHGVVKSYRGQHSGRVFAEQFNPPKTLDYDGASVRAIHAVAFRL